MHYELNRYKTASCEAVNTACAPLFAKPAGSTPATKDLANVTCRRCLKTRRYQTDLAVAKLLGRMKPDDFEQRLQSIASTLRHADVIIATNSTAAPSFNRRVLEEIAAHLEWISSVISEPTEKGS